MAPPSGTAPGAVPLLGHLLALRRQPLDFFASLPAHGDLTAIRIGPWQAFVACHPDVVNQVLLDSRTFDKGGFFWDKVRQFVGNGLASSSWADHRQQRRLMQPAFHPARMPKYADLMAEEIGATMGSWAPDKIIDVGATMQIITSRVTTRALFSTDIGTRTVTEVQESLPIIMAESYRRMILPISLLERLPTPGNRRFNAARARLHGLIKALTDDYQATGADHGDLMSALLSARTDESGEPMTPVEIRDQLMTVLIGGTETTAALLAWTFHLLGEHPEVRNKLYAEIDDVVGGQAASFGDLPRLEYTQRVLTEALRLRPPIWVNTRVTTTECELAGYRLPAGATVIVSPYVLHHNPELFPDPQRFDPDRWLPERAKGVPRGAMLPFGAGNRKCIGDVFGMTEAALALAMITARWQLQPVPGMTVRPVPKATLGTGTLPMTCRPRGVAVRGEVQEKG